MAVWSYENTVWSKMTKRDWKWLAALVVVTVVSVFITMIDADLRFTDQVEFWRRRSDIMEKQGGDVMVINGPEFTTVFTSAHGGCGNIYSFISFNSAHQRFTGCWNFKPDGVGINAYFTNNYTGRVTTISPDRGSITIENPVVYLRLRQELVGM